MVSPVLFLEEEKMIRYVVDTITSVEVIEDFGRRQDDSVVVSAYFRII